MTREEKIEWLESIPSETISPYQLSVVAGGDSYSYNIAAREGKFPLPHLWRGRNLRIWKGPVIRLIGGGFDVLPRGADDNRSAVFCEGNA